MIYFYTEFIFIDFLILILYRDQKRELISATIKRRRITCSQPGLEVKLFTNKHRIQEILFTNLHVYETLRQC